MRRTNNVENKISSVNLYESLGSQFFRTTTGIKSGPGIFDESSLVMTF